MSVLALKRLSRSDLGIFQSHHGVTTKSNQKCINLNGDVFVDTFFPTLVGLRERKFPVVLSTFGPGGRPEVVASHHVGFYQKNWRLNGAFIRPAPGDPGSFDELAPGDIVALRFHGDVTPESRVEALFVQASDPTDADLHGRLLSVMGRKSMCVLDESVLASAVSSASLPTGHSAFAFISDPALVIELAEAASGGETSIRKAIVRRAGRPVSSETLAKAKAAAEEIGRLGELLVAGHLADYAVRNPGGAFSFEWVSQANAVAPLDFRWTSTGGKLGDRAESLDVKATRSDFARDIHLSIAELREAAGSAQPYRIYRVYGISEAGAKLRRSEDIRPFAKALVLAHDAAMPSGVTVDAFSIAPEASAIAWEPEEALKPPES